MTIRHRMSYWIVRQKHIARNAFTNGGCKETLRHHLWVGIASAAAGIGTEVVNSFLSSHGVDSSRVRFTVDRSLTHGSGDPRRNPLHGSGPTTRL